MNSYTRKAVSLLNAFIILFSVNLISNSFRDSLLSTFIRPTVNKSSNHNKIIRFPRMGDYLKVMEQPPRDIIRAKSRSKMNNKIGKNL